MMPTMDLRPSDRLYDKVRQSIPAIEWPAFAADIDAIMALKRTRNAIVLAHNYQTPEIFHCVADIVGDSLALAREARDAEADVIVLAGVNFMAETAKLLNPSKTVLIPDRGAGCSLADSITPDDVRLLRQMLPGVPVVTYVDTSAAVKAESDICCTSGNAKAVIESASEQPALRSGISTVFCGLSSFAVSAMKWTPASTMMSASTLVASRANSRLSPTMSATPWKISGV